jgi:hypothetical protein
MEAISLAPIIQKSLVGYCALRRNPWHFVGIYATREEAEQWAKMAGKDHEVAFGAYRERSDDFVALRPDQEIDYGIEVSPE